MALFLLLWENSAAPAAGSFAHGGKGTKTPFLVGHLRPVFSTGGQNLSGVFPSFRATGHAFLKESLAKNFVRNFVSLLLGPPGRCHVVSPGGVRRAHNMRPYNGGSVLCVGADTIRPPGLGPAPEKPGTSSPESALNLPKRNAVSQEAFLPTFFSKKVGQESVRGEMRTTMAVRSSVAP